VTVKTAGHRKNCTPFRANKKGNLPPILTNRLENTKMFVITEIEEKLDIISWTETTAAGRQSKI
jgi:hypothetical protein